MEVYQPQRPLRRFLAQHEGLRGMIAAKARFAKEVGGLSYAAQSRGAKVDEVAFVRYLTTPYEEWRIARNAEWDESIPREVHKKERNYYLTDEGIMRLCDYYDVSITLLVELNEKHYLTLGQHLAKEADLSLSPHRRKKLEEAARKISSNGGDSVDA